MNKSMFRTFGLLPIMIFMLMASGQKANAQLADVGDFLQAGADDATALTRAYLTPLATGLTTSLNSGWNNTAAPRKTLGFSLDIRVGAALVPGADQDFNVNDLGLTNLAVAPGQDPVSPTLAGNSGAGPQLNLVNGGVPTGTSFELPGGAGVSLVPAPVVQAGIGLIKDTDITVRFIPETSIGDYGDISLVGGAVKHGINQYLPAEKLLPVDISVMFAYTQVNLNANLDAAGGSGQKIETTTNAWVLNALVGKSLPLVALYGGVGVQGGSMDVDILGDFQVDTGLGGGTISDPVSYSADSDASVHILGGARLRLGFLAFYVESMVSNYTTVNAGVGISFR